MNQERFNQALAAIRRGEAGGLRAQLDMSTWARRKRSWSTQGCKTTLCLAGWAATLAGDPPAFSDALDSVPELTVSGRSIEAVGAEWLELDRSERDLLYAEHCYTTEQLRREAWARGCLRGSQW